MLFLRSAVLKLLHVVKCGEHLPAKLHVLLVEFLIDLCRWDRVLLYFGVCISLTLSRHSTSPLNMHIRGRVGGSGRRIF